MTYNQIFAQSYDRSLKSAQADAAIRHQRATEIYNQLMLQRLMENDTYHRQQDVYVPFGGGGGGSGSGGGGTSGGTSTNPSVEPPLPVADNPLGGEGDGGDEMTPAPAPDLVSKYTSPDGPRQFLAPQSSASLMQLYAPKPAVTPDTYLKVPSTPIPTEAEIGSAPAASPAAPVASPAQPASTGGLPPDAIARIDEAGAHFGKKAAQAQYAREVAALQRPARNIDPNSPEGIDAAVKKYTAIQAIKPAPVRNIDPLSPEGIAAGTERQRQIQTVKPVPGISGLDTSMRHSEADLRGFVDANIGIPLENLMDPNAKRVFSEVDGGGNPQTGGGYVKMATPDGKSVVVPTKIYNEYRQKATVLMEMRKQRATLGQPAQSQAQPAATGAPVKVASADDYNALPSGAVYVDPDGATRRKP